MLRVAARVIVVGGLLVGGAHASQGPAASEALARPSSWVPLQQLKAAAHRAGMTALIAAWQGYKTSTTAELYPQYYGRTWDEAHAARPATTTVTTTVTTTTVTTPPSKPAVPAPAKDETRKATAPDPARLAALVKTLSMSRAGRQALAVLGKHGVRVEFIPGSDAGYHSPARNLIAIGDQRPHDDAVNVLIHELNHAWTRHRGKAASLAMPRQQYVDEKIRDEAQGDAWVAVAAREFGRINRRAAQTGIKADVTVKSTTRLYLDAYRRVISAGRAARQGKPSQPVGGT